MVYCDAKKNGKITKYLCYHFNFLLEEALDYSRSIRIDRGQRKITKQIIQRASEADYQSCSIEISDNWRASVASETLTGVTQLKIGDVCLLASPA